MDAPDQRLFEADIADAAFLIGARKRFWGLAAADLVPPELVWPRRILWLAAAPLPNSSDRFYLLLDLAGYRTASPTGAFWDPATKAALALGKWPKGKGGSRFAKVFRTDWAGGRAFYHPYDRVTAQSHPQWTTEQPHLIWSAKLTIVDYLEEFHGLLQGSDYVGV
jgi:hypothetical protein